MLMINSKTNSIEWSTLLYELGDASEHILNLINQMQSNGKIDKEDYEVQLGHIFAHLNRAWHTRNKVGEYSDEEREQFTEFPKDLYPCG